MRVPGFRRTFRFPWRTGREILAEVNEELDFHVEMRTEELVAEGLSPEAAVRRAQIDFGDLDAARRSLGAQGRRREARSRKLLIVEELSQDLRFAIRGLRRNPGFTATAVLVLALAIGANATIFSIVNGLLLRPLVIGEPERLTRIYGKDTTKPDSYRSFSYPNYVDLRQRSTAFEKLAAFNPTIVGIDQGGDTTQRKFAQLISSNYFATMGVALSKGRSFTPEEERPNSGIQVAILGYGLWERSGADPDPLGKTLRINGGDFTIVGVSPRGFTGVSAIIATDVWLPLGVYGTAVRDFLDSTVRDLNDRDRHTLMVLGRLRRGQSRESAAPELAALSEQLAADFPKINGNHTFITSTASRLGMSNRPMTDGPIILAAVLLMAMAGTVLLIACLNLANMLLSRGAARRTEIAIRQSLGGGRIRILRQLLTEGLVLSLLGGSAGLVLAVWGANLITSSILPILPFGGLEFDLTPDVRVLSATIGFCILSTVLFGLGPALKLVRKDVHAGLKASSRHLSRSGGIRGLVPRNALLVAQLSLSLVLLTAAGLFVRGALRAGEHEPAFQVERGLLVEFDGGLASYDEVRTRQIYAQILERLRALPGVEHAALASNVPLSTMLEGDTILPPGGENWDEEGIDSQKYIVSRDYFRTMELPLLQGRDFTEAEATSDTGPAVVIVDEPLARRMRPDGDVIGRFIKVRDGGQGGEVFSLEIVGVAPGVRQMLIEKEAGPHIYLPFGQNYRSLMTAHLRIDRDGKEAESAALQAVRREIAAVDDRLPILSIKSFRSHLDQGIELWLFKTGARVFTAFGGVALFLALIGVYGVKAYGVSRRKREIGIRMALGARQIDILWLMLREAFIVTAIGLSLGMVMAFFLGMGLSTVLYEVSGTDPLTFIAAPLLLATAALLAAYLPSRRACRMPPTIALRHE